jgi:hypothetical protein
VELGLREDTLWGLTNIKDVKDVASTLEVEEMPSASS